MRDLVLERNGARDGSWIKGDGDRLGLHLRGHFLRGKPAAVQLVPSGVATGFGEDSFRMPRSCQPVLSELTAARITGAAVRVG